jgi:hypothetical protein
VLCLATHDGEVLAVGGVPAAQSSNRNPNSANATPRKTTTPAFLLIALLTLPLTAHALAGGSPFDTGFAALQDDFTGTVAKVPSLIAIVIGGYGPQT